MHSYYSDLGPKARIFVDSVIWSHHDFKTLPRWLNQARFLTNMRNSLAKVLIDAVQKGYTIVDVGRDFLVAPILSKKLPSAITLMETYGKDSNFYISIPQRVIREMEKTESLISRPSVPKNIAYSPIWFGRSLTGGFSHSFGYSYSPLAYYLQR